MKCFLIIVVLLKFCTCQQSSDELTEAFQRVIDRFQEGLDSVPELSVALNLTTSSDNEDGEFFETIGQLIKYNVIATFAISTGQVVEEIAQTIDSDLERLKPVFDEVKFVKTSRKTICICAFVCNLPVNNIFLPLTDRRFREKLCPIFFISSGVHRGCDYIV